MKRVRVQFEFEIPVWDDLDERRHDPVAVADIIADALRRLQWGIDLDPGDVTVEEMPAQVAT